MGNFSLFLKTTSEGKAFCFKFYERELKEPCVLTSRGRLASSLPGSNWNINYNITTEKRLLLAIFKLQVKPIFWKTSIIYVDNYSF